ncbi:MAG: hypothetical protein Q8O83_01825 [bacterium]|nr:hypothetical protein [bacterium]
MKNLLKKYEAGKTNKQILANRAIARAESCLNFLDECLQLVHRGSGTDPAYSRSIYILFSYSFELILKSRLLLASKQVERDDLIKEIKSHDLEKLSKKLSKTELNNISIKNIKKQKTLNFEEYKIEMTGGGDFIIQDLTDVRYDFAKDNLRNNNLDEWNQLQEMKEVMFYMIKFIREMIK